MERTPVSIQSVKDIQDSGKRWLEELLGQRLRENQQVFIMVFTPGIPPTEAARQEARAGLEQTWAKVERHMQDQGVTGEEFDAAVDEAVDQIRRREP